MRKFLYNGREIVTKFDDGHEEHRDVAGRQQAWGLLVIKEFDEKTRRFKGVASTITPDRMDDIVDPKGAVFKLPIPFLYQHDSSKPIGWIDVANITGTQIKVEGF